MKRNQKQRKLKPRHRRLLARAKHRKVKLKSRRGRRPQTPDELRTLLKGQRRENKQLRRILEQSYVIINDISTTLARMQHRQAIEQGHPADGM